MSLEKSNMPLSAKQITVMDTNNKFDFNHLVQRGLVWERSRKSYLIESMILGYDISRIYCRRDRDDSTVRKKGSSTYVILDGKQRITTISAFIRNEWSLTELNPVSYTAYDGEQKVVEISNKTFEELPEELQDAIKDTSISFVCYDNITFQEERELFKRLNAGKPLSTKARLLSNCKDLEHILDIGTHPIFKEMLTENALNQRNHVTIIMKAWSMLNQDINNVSFESKYFNPLVEEVEISDDESCELADCFDYMMEVHDYILAQGDSREIKKIAKKFYTETHFVSFTSFIKSAVEDSIDPPIFGDWVIHFFRGEDELDIDKYDAAVLKGSAKNENIRIRNDVLAISWNKFFEEDL